MIALLNKNIIYGWINFVLHLKGTRGSMANIINIKLMKIENNYLKNMS